jgi:transcriptional regulator with XRE-family HTH domain
MERAMAKTLSEVMKRLPRERRERIEAETAEEAARIMSLRDVRKAFHKSQEELAKTLDMEQESVSRIERRADLLLSTMRKYVAAMGGDLKLIAEFPDRPAIRIDTLGTLKEEKKEAARTRKRGSRPLRLR